ncbi:MULTISPECIES: alpha/beta hydrolase [unclassified Streptomyces]|uniref:Alpha/beta hydrolase n=1 Tax=Streptomyces sp. NBC_00060 TaxID=2975636 RepID=A0AAU2GSA5_9ACTN
MQPQSHPSSDSESILKTLREQGFPPLESADIPELRLLVGRLRQAQGPPEPVARVVDTLVPGPAGMLPVRVYQPEPRPGPRPLLVFFHGGGWAAGDVDLVDRPLRRLANATGAVVASAGYRLAPETQFPGPQHDAYAALCALAARPAELGADPGHLIVAGESAGANLAAAACRTAVDEGGPRPALQILICPPLAPARNTPFASYREKAVGYLNTRAAMERFWELYVPDPGAARSPLAAPLLADDFSALPPALVLTAEHDPLRDEGEEYARRLERDGVPATVSRMPGALHIFFLLPHLAAFGTALRDIEHAVRAHPPTAPRSRPGPRCEVAPS